MKKDKIYWFLDQEDYLKILTDDDVVNVVGSKGSGKTTLSMNYIEDDDYIVINCDRVLELPGGVEDRELGKIRELLKKKYGEVLQGEDFLKCYLDIVSYILKRGKKAFLEGNLLQDIIPITSLKGKVIVKRTGILKSFIRAVKRDYQNEYFMKIEKEKYGEFGRVTRFFHIFKRRLSIFRQAKTIQKIIDDLENA